MTLQTVGPDPAGVRHRGAEEEVPARDPRRRGALRDRLHRARGRHRPGLAAHHRGPRTATSTSSTARRSSPPAATTPTTSGWPCRTDPDAAKHKGISILIVDTKDPGYSWTPIITADGAHHTNATYYNDVRVPADMLVGEENGGWRLITTQLNHERVMLGPAGRIGGHLRPRARLGAKPGGDGAPPIDHDDVRRALGEIERRSGGSTSCSTGRSPPPARPSTIADAAATKVFATERIQRDRPTGRGDRRHATATRPIRRPPSCWTGSTGRPSATW